MLVCIKLFEKLFVILTFGHQGHIPNGRKQELKMDSDDCFSDYELDGTDPWDDLENIVSKPTPFETLTTDDIVQLMNQYIEQVIAVVKVSENVINVLHSLNDEIFIKFDLICNLDASDNHTNSIKPHKMGETSSS